MPSRKKFNSQHLSLEIVHTRNQTVTGCGDDAALKKPRGTFGRGGFFRPIRLLQMSENPNGAFVI